MRERGVKGGGERRSTERGGRCNVYYSCGWAVPILYTVERASYRCFAYQSYYTHVW